MTIRGSTVLHAEQKTLRSVDARRHLDRVRRLSQDVRRSDSSGYRAM